MTIPIGAANRPRRRVLLLAYGATTVSAGYHRRVLLMARSLTQAGHGVVLLWLVNRWGAFATDLPHILPEGASVIRLPVLPVARWRWLAPISRALCMLAARLIYTAYRCDAVHGETELCGALGHWCPAQDFVVDYHGDTVAERMMSAAPAWTIDAARKDAALARSRATSSIVVSEALAQQLIQSGIHPSTIQTLPCVVDIEAFEAAAELRAQVRSALHAEDRLVLCYCGGLQKWQAIDKTLAIVRELIRHDKTLFFLLITSDNAASVRKELAEMGCEGSDFAIISASAGEVPRWLAAADAGFVIREDSPVNRVASPTKLAEYLAVGVPVISTPYAADASVILSKYQCGLVLEDTDCRGAQAALRSFLSDVSAHRHGWAERARFAAKTCYDSAVAAAAVDRCYAPTRRADLDASRTRLRVLLCAYEISPDQGSECAVGWQLALKLSRYHDITVLCPTGSQSNPKAYRTAIERYQSNHGPIHGLTVQFVSAPRLALWAARVNRRLCGMKDGVGIRPLFQFALRAWHREAQRQVQRAGSAFDVLHHLTPIAYWAAGTLWKGVSVPYCWGPVGGLMNAPRAFSFWLGWKQFATDTLRAGFNSVRIRSSWALRAAIRRSHVIWTIPGGETAAFQRLSAKPPRPLIEAGTPDNVVGRVRRYQTGRPLVLCWSGRHNHGKALPILLHALALLPKSAPVRVMILGSGSETTLWKKLASRLGVAEKLEWCGKLEHREAIEKMDEAHAFVHTSIREGTPHVIVEAIASGLPVICHDAFGMGAAVDPTCGIKIPLIDPQYSITGFRDAIAQLLDSPARIEALSRGALTRRDALSWDRKAETIAAAYTECARARHLVN